MLAQVLSAGTVTSEHLVAAPAESLKTIWPRLRRAYPADFSTSEKEVAEWHQAQAEESEMDEQWFAAVFHLERLLARHPDAALTKRLKCARAHLNSNN